MENIKLGSIRRGTLSSYVYETLKESIIKNKISSGARLTEKMVCEMLDVSSTPVREAFNKLANDGLIDVIPYKGVKVKQIDYNDLKEAYSCRIAFERLSVKQAIENFTPEFLNELYMILEKSKYAVDHQEYVEKNTLLHNTILEQSKNKRLKAFFKQLEDIVIHNRMHSSYSDDRKIQINEEHMTIIKHIAEKDTVKAQNAMEEHIVNGFNYMKKVLDKPDLDLYAHDAVELP